MTKYMQLRRARLVFAVLLAFASHAPAPSAPLPPRHPSLPGPVLPDGLGVNIHFTDPRPGEMKMLAAAGFRWIRMDFGWGRTERERGVYDFSAYDRLLAALDEHKIKPVFILDYGNKLYSPVSPATEEPRAAFARWAAAAVSRFKGRGILWEMWNEPNIGFWRPKPNVDDYVKLALAAGRAIRAAAPDEAYIGPALAFMDLGFLEACFKAGLLEYWDAVSVHPYRQQPPETVAADYEKLRALIARHAPPGKNVPILSGEWGYTSQAKERSEDVQGRYLPRMWLTNIMSGVPLSIWYDWHDDGPNPEEREHRFGAVRFPYFEGREPVYDLKPAYLAAQTFTRFFDGYRFERRLPVGTPDDFVLLFKKGDAMRLAVWTAAAEPRVVTLPLAGRVEAVGHLGMSLPAMEATREGLALTLTPSPLY